MKTIHDYIAVIIGTPHNESEVVLIRKTAASAELERNDMPMSRKSMIKPYKHCKKCGALIVSGELCEDCKPITNADRIRQMTDEELVKSIGLACKRCAYYKVGYGECFGLNKDCTAGNLEWLKQEVSEDAGSKTD